MHYAVIIVLLACINSVISDEPIKSIHDDASEISSEDTVSLFKGLDEDLKVLVKLILYYVEILRNNTSESIIKKAEEDVNALADVFIKHGKPMLDQLLKNGNISGVTVKMEKVVNSLKDFIRNNTPDNKDKLDLIEKLDALYINTLKNVLQKMGYQIAEWQARTLSVKEEVNDKKSIENYIKKKILRTEGESNIGKNDRKPANLYEKDDIVDYIDSIEVSKNKLRRWSNSNDYINMYTDNDFYNFYDPNDNKYSKNYNPDMNNEIKIVFTDSKDVLERPGNEILENDIKGRLLPLSNDLNITLHTTKQNNKTVLINKDNNASKVEIGRLFSYLSDNSGMYTSILSDSSDIINFTLKEPHDSYENKTSFEIPKISQPKLSKIIEALRNYYDEIKLLTQKSSKLSNKDKTVIKNFEPELNKLIEALRKRHDAHHVKDDYYDDDDDDDDNDDNDDYDYSDDYDNSDDYDRDANNDDSDKNKVLAKPQSNKGSVWYEKKKLNLSNNLKEIFSRNKKKDRSAILNRAIPSKYLLLGRKIIDAIVLSVKYLYSETNLGWNPKHSDMDIFLNILYSNLINIPRIFENEESFSIDNDNDLLNVALPQVMLIAASDQRTMFYKEITTVHGNDNDIKRNQFRILYVLLNEIVKALNNYINQMHSKPSDLSDARTVFEKSLITLSNAIKQLRDYKTNPNPNVSSSEQEYIVITTQFLNEIIEVINYVINKTIKHKKPPLNNIPNDDDPQSGLRKWLENKLLNAITQMLDSMKDNKLSDDNTNSFIQFILEIVKLFIDYFNFKTKSSSINDLNIKTLEKLITDSVKETKESYNKGIITEESMTEEMYSAVMNALQKMLRNNNYYKFDSKEFSNEVHTTKIKIIEYHHKHKIVSEDELTSDTKQSFEEQLLNNIKEFLTRYHEKHENHSEKEKIQMFLKAVMEVVKYVTEHRNKQLDSGNNENDPFEMFRDLKKISSFSTNNSELGNLLISTIEAIIRAKYKHHEPYDPQKMIKSFLNAIIEIISMIENNKNSDNDQIIDKIIIESTKIMITSPDERNPVTDSPLTLNSDDENDTSNYILDGLKSIIEIINKNNHKKTPQKNDDNEILENILKELGNSTGYHVLSSEETDYTNVINQIIRKLRKRNTLISKEQLQIILHKINDVLNNNRLNNKTKELLNQILEEIKSLINKNIISKGNKKIYKKILNLLEKIFGYDLNNLVKPDSQSEKTYIDVIIKIINNQTTSTKDASKVNLAEQMYQEIMEILNESENLDKVINWKKIYNIIKQKYKNYQPNNEKEWFSKIFEIIKEFSQSSQQSNDTGYINFEEVDIDSIDDLIKHIVNVTVRIVEQPKRGQIDRIIVKILDTRNTIQTEIVPESIKKELEILFNQIKDIIENKNNSLDHNQHLISPDAEELLKIIMESLNLSYDAKNTEQNIVIVIEKLLEKYEVSVSEEDYDSKINKDLLESILDQLSNLRKKLKDHNIDSNDKDALLKILENIFKLMNKKKPSSSKKIISKNKWGVKIIEIINKLLKNKKQSEYSSNSDSEILVDLMDEVAKLRNETTNSNYLLNKDKIYGIDIILSEIIKTFNKVENEDNILTQDKELKELYFKIVEIFKKNKDLNDNDKKKVPSPTLDSDSLNQIIKDILDKLNHKDTKENKNDGSNKIDLNELLEEIYKKSIKKQQMILNESYVIESDQDIEFTFLMKKPTIQIKFDVVKIVIPSQNLINKNVDNDLFSSSEMSNDGRQGTKDLQNLLATGTLVDIKMKNRTTSIYNSLNKRKWLKNIDETYGVSLAEEITNNDDFPNNISQDDKIKDASNDFVNINSRQLPPYLDDSDGRKPPPYVDPTYGRTPLQNGNDTDGRKLPPFISGSIGRSIAKPMAILTYDRTPLPNEHDTDLPNENDTDGRKLPPFISGSIGRSIAKPMATPTYDRTPLPNEYDTDLPNGNDTDGRKLPPFISGSIGRSIAKPMATPTYDRTPLPNEHDTDLPNGNDTDGRKLPPFISGSIGRSIAKPMATPTYDRTPLPNEHDTDLQNGNDTDGRKLPPFISGSIGRSIAKPIDIPTETEPIQKIKLSIHDQTEDNKLELESSINDETKLKTIPSSNFLPKSNSIANDVVMAPVKNQTLESVESKEFNTNSRNGYLPDPYDPLETGIVMSD